MTTFFSRTHLKHFTNFYSKTVQEEEKKKKDAELEFVYTFGPILLSVICLRMFCHSQFVQAPDMRVHVSDPVCSVCVPHWVYSGDSAVFHSSEAFFLCVGLG